MSARSLIDCTASPARRGFELAVSSRGARADAARGRRAACRAAESCRRRLRRARRRAARTRPATPGRRPARTVVRLSAGLGSTGLRRSPFPACRAGSGAIRIWPANSAIDELAVFFEAAERLLGPLQTAGTNVPRVLERFARRRRNLRADIALRVARRVPIGRTRSRPPRPPRSCRSAFACARQKRVVEHEPHVVFDHAQPLAGPVERGIEDSNNGGVRHGGQVVIATVATTVLMAS